MFNAMGGSGHWFGGAFMWIFWIVLFVVVLWAASGLLDKSNTDKTESALDILKKRFAKGEIDKDEFERKRKEIE